MNCTIGHGSLRVKMIFACIWIFNFIVTAKDYTSYHFEWNNPSEWFTNSHHGDIISCTAKIPSLCIYAIPNQVGFQLFYKDLMFDFLNDDDQWTKINIIDIVVGDNNNNKYIDKMLKRRSPQKASSRRRLRRERRKRRRKKRKNPYRGLSRLGNYGCFNALCTTVLGAPRIISPPRRRRKRTRCGRRKCGNRYPAYMFIGPGMMARMGMGGMGGMGMGGMGMGGMGMMSPMMWGMGGMGMGGMGMGRRRMMNDNDRNGIDEREYKIIQKCVVIDSKDICLTYYYFDASITLDYNVAKHTLLEDIEDDNCKYFTTSAWIWNNEGPQCNDRLLKGGNICVVKDDKDIIIQLKKRTNSQEITFNLSQISNEETWSEVYDVEFSRDDKLFHKMKVCQNISISESKAKVCFETLNNNADIQEMQISVENVINNV